MQLRKTLTDRDVILPLPSEAHGQDVLDILNRFMRHLRHVPSSRRDIQILSAIQFTADMLDYSDAHVSKILVDLGLRAPRMAFPADFLRYCDMALMRSGWEVGGPSPSLTALKAYWDEIGEDKFAAGKLGEHSVTSLYVCY